MTAPIVVIGVGNSWRGDDGVGPAVAEAIAARPRQGVEVRLLDGEPCRLIDAWQGAGLTVVVDAMRGAGPVGRVRRLDGRNLDPVLGAGGGSHSVGVAEAASLARRLGRLPAALVVVAVEGAHFSLGDRMCPEVAQAIAPAVQAVIGEIERWQRIGREASCA